MVLFVMPWLVSQALTGATRALYSRGDFDLMLASPVSPRAILAAHALAIAVESLLSVGIFLAPMIDAIALRGGARWLAGFPALAAASLFATALGLCLTLALFAVAGPRLTRVIAQIAATVIGAGFVLALQALNVLPAHVRHAIVARIGAPGSDMLFDRDGPLWLPVRAALGAPLDLTLWCLISVAFFAAAALGLGRNFALSAIRSAALAERPREKRRRRRSPFRVGLAASLRFKEWRLLARDPWLLSQILLQIVYTLPIAVVLWRSQGGAGSIGVSVAPAVVVIASQIAASLAWLAISSEDAPEFIATAPVTRREVERRKLEAIGLPLALFLAAPILGLAFYSIFVAALTALFCAGAAASTALLNLWHPMPGRRAQVLRRHSQSKLVAVVEHMLSLCWALAMALASLGSAWTAPAIGAAVGLLWLNRPRGPQIAPARARALLWIASSLRSSR
jgi:ABC-2 type transport system permease protein